MHQMGLAEPDPAIEEQRVERHRAHRAGAGLGDPPRRGMGELVGLADDEILEGEARVEARQLRPVFADFERRGRRARPARSDVQSDPRRGPRVAGGGICSRSRWRPADDDYRNPLNLPVLRPPQRQDPVGVMRRDPIAKKPRRRGDYRLAAIDPLDADRSEPAAIGGFADLFLELAEDPVPFVLRRRHRAFGAIYLTRSRHHRIPPIKTAAPPDPSPVNSTSLKRKYFPLCCCHP